jgi:hypothetical protein
VEETVRRVYLAEVVVLGGASVVELGEVVGGYRTSVDAKWPAAVVYFLLEYSR